MRTSKETASAAQSTDTPPNWKRMRFKNNKVWVGIDTCGNPLVENGRLLIKYRLDQDTTYRALAHHVKPLDAPYEKIPRTGQPQSTAGSPSTENNARQPSQRVQSEAIHVYTDGAASGNPGPAGIGILLRYGVREKKISKFIGHSTNNIAELEAIRVALSEISTTNLPVILYTDSNYAFGLLTQNWKAKKNQELVAQLRELVQRFKSLRFVKVKGHAGDEGNETADKLATDAIKNHT